MSSDRQAMREALIADPRLIPAVRFALEVIQNTLIDGLDWDPCDVIDLAEMKGLVRKTKYDPAVHGENSVDAEPGDPWYVIVDFPLLFEIENPKKVTS